MSGKRMGAAASFDTHLDGDPASVTAAATWARSFATQVDNSATLTTRAERKSGEVWEGAAADGYRGFAKDVVSASDGVEQAGNDVAEKFDAFAQQMQWTKEDLAEQLNAAAAGGLQVEGTVVHSPPIPVQPVVPEAEGANPPPEAVQLKDQLQAEYEEAKRKEELYRSLLKKVEELFTEYDEWIALNLKADEPAVQVTTASNLAAAAAQDAAFGALSTGFQVAKSKFEEKGNALIAAATQKATQTAARRSGNPAVRAGAKPPAPENVEKRLLKDPKYHAGKQALKLAKGIGRAGAAVGAGVTAVTLGVEVASGTPVTQVLAEEAGGWVGSGVGLALGSVAGPVGMTLGSAIGRQMGSDLAAQLHDNAIPQPVREAIDEGYRDFVGDVFDLAQRAYADDYNTYAPIA